MLDDASPPRSKLLGRATTVEVAAPPVATMVEDEASHLRAQLEAMQAAIAWSKWEATTTRASHVEAQVQLLSKLLVRILVRPSRGVLS
jgi:hypothetical protein